MHFVCPTVTRDTRDMFERAVHEHQRTDLPLTLLFGHSHEALAAADLALVASGTATLETALFKTPMVITYRQSPITWALMRRMIYLPYVGMPNVLAGEKLVPSCCRTRRTRRRSPARCSRCCATPRRSAARSSASTNSTTCCGRTRRTRRRTRSRG